jgi:hypothetical protein
MKINVNRRQWARSPTHVWAWWGLVTACIVLVSAGCQPTGSPSATLPPTIAAVPTASPTHTPSPTATQANTPTPSPTLTPASTPTPTATATPPPTPTLSPTPSPTPVPTLHLARRYQMTYEIEHPTELGRQEMVDQLWMPLPNTDGGGTTQFKLLEVYPSEYQILDIGQSNRAVYWENVPDLCQQTNCRFGIRFQVTLERPMYTIPWNAPVSYDVASDLYQVYTQPERGIQSDDPQVRELAAQIVGGETNVYKQVLLLQAWVQQNVRYPQMGSTYPDDALLCIDQGSGDCAGQSKVLVALCRALGIPARTVSGLLPFERGTGPLEVFGPRAAWFDQDLSVHVWVEVYFPELGWVQGEPDMPGFGIDNERLITKRGPFAFQDGLCQQATYFHLPLAVRGNWCGQSVGWEVSIDAQVLE